MTAVFDLTAYLATEGERVQAALERILGASRARVESSVGRAMEHGVLSDGKRLRPILCGAAFRACGGRGDEEAVYELSAAVELIHAYSLMHDDLPCMDDAELRRGQPTTHRVHGEAASTVAGAALIPLAASTAWNAARALGCGDEEARGVVNALLESAGAGGMVGGQWLDLEAEAQGLGGPALDALHGRKTGALLAASLLMGARAAGAHPQVGEALLRYGRSIGLAFQIKDDVLDATRSAEALGKNPSDAALSKSTYTAIYGVGEADRRARAIVGEALEALKEAGLDAPALEALARFVVDREK